MSGNALVEAGSNEDVVEEVCSTTEAFEADRAYTSNDLCVAARLERDVEELQGDGALDRAYLRGLASFVYGEQDNAIESLRSQMRALQEAVAHQQRVSGLRLEDLQQQRRVVGATQASATRSRSHRQPEQQEQ